MSLKVRLYSSTPPIVKQAITDTYIELRKAREWFAAKRLRRMEVDRSKPKTVFVTGFPRSGTTVMKYYFGTHQGLRQSPFDPVGFFRVWLRSLSVPEILVDKSNHYMYSLDNIFTACGRSARICTIVRDPRDCLVSFTAYEENREVPRNRRYWPYWSRQHAEFLRFAERGEHEDSIFVVRYEDFVRFPQQSKAGFLTWLGIPTRAEDVTAEYVNQTPGDGWRDSVHNHRVVGTHAVQKWQQPRELPAWATAALSSWQDDPLSVELMRKFGYTDQGFIDELEPLRGVTLFRPDAT